MKILNVKNLTASTILCVSLLSANAANAALVNFTVDGEITSSTIGNFFGLNVGDTVTAYGTYEDAPIAASTPGTTYIDFTLASNTIELSMGDVLYTLADGVSGGTQLFFQDNVFDGINYEASNGLFDSWGYLGTGSTDNVGFNGYNDNVDILFGGNWLVDTFTVTPVPVPAAIWLFATGALFMTGIARRKTIKA